MIVACPSCKAKYKVDEAKVGDQGMKLRCSKCQTIFKVSKKAEGEASAEMPAQQPAAAPKPAAAPPPRPAAPPAPKPPAAPPKPAAPALPSLKQFAGSTVLIATEIDSVRDMLLNIFAENQIVAIQTTDGIEALEIIKNERPKTAILDVMLPKLMGFEICELMKNDSALRGIPVVLIAAQGNSHRFKRPPKSLYGADGYLEIKDIQTLAVPMLADLLAGKKPRMAMAESEIFPHATAPVATPQQPPAAPKPQPKPAPAPAPAPKPQPKPAPPPPPPPPPEPEPEPESQLSPEEQKEHEKAKRLARIIVSDIKLYNQDAIGEGVTNGTFYQLLEKDIGDARRLYIQRIPEKVRSNSNYLEDALENLIKDKKKELGIE